MAQEQSTKLNSQISAEAAEWLVEFRSGDMDLDARRDFDAWLRASPEHLRAFIEMTQLWNHAKNIDPERKIIIEELLASGYADDNVVALERVSEWVGVSGSSADKRDSNSQSANPAAWQRSSRWLRRTSLAAALIIGVGLAWFSWSWLGGSSTYVTAVGEQRSISLADGSKVTLNARSRLRVRFNAATRSVELLEGQAFFHVAKNPARPFIVLSDDTAVRAVGTQFDVNRNRRGTTVTVLEGRVAVYPEQLHDALQTAATECSGTSQSCEGQLSESGAPAAPATGSDRLVLLSADEQVRIAAGQSAMQPVRVDATSAAGWRQGRIVFDSATLLEIADEFNRYSSRQFRAEDHGPTPLRLSGVFTTDPDFFIQYLRELPGITVRESDKEISVVRNLAQPQSGSADARE